MAREVTQFVGERSRADDARERDQRARLRPAGLDATLGADLNAQRRQKRKAQLQRFSGEGRKPRARPALAIEKLVEQKAKGHRGGGL